MIVESIDDYLKKEYDDNERVYKIGTYHAGDLSGNCLRQVWYRYIIPGIFDMYKAGVMMRGKVYEAWIAHEVLPLVRPDWKIKTQVEMVDKYTRGKQEITIQGHADINVNNKIIEIKTIDTKRLDWLTEPKIEHLLQLNYYCWKLKLGGVLLYIAPGTLVRKEFPVEPKETEAQKLIDKAFIIDQALRDAKAPECNTHWACDRSNRDRKVYCDFATRCVQDGNVKLDEIMKVNMRRY